MRGKSKPCVMSNLLIMHVIAKKFWEGEEKKERRKIVVTSDGTLFCRLCKKEDEEGEGAE